jgi:hypothetical protein
MVWAPGNTTDTNGDTFGGTARGPGVAFYTLTMNLGVGTTPFTFFIANDTVVGSADAAIGHVQPLINVELFGDMSDRDFFVDELPIFPGNIILQGVWGNPLAHQSDWHRERLPQPTIYAWRWVFNEGGFATQDPGVLLQIGTWGDVTGQGWIPGNPWEGLRIPVRNLWQVERMEFDPPELVFSEPIFFDDPFFLGSEEEGWRIENWTRGVLRENTLVVHYRGGPGVTPPAPRRFSFADFTNLQTTDPDDPQAGWGIWSAPIIRFDTGPVLSSTYNGVSVGGVMMRTSAHDNADSPALGWSNWLTNANQRITIRYRSAPPITVRVPIYNQLTSIAVTSAAPVVLNGFGVVDVRSEGQSEFLNQVVITGTFSQNLGGAPVERDILASIATGRMRGAVTPPGTDAATSPSAGTLIAAFGVVENMNNAPMTSPGPAGVGFTVATNIHQGGLNANGWMNPSIFTTANSNNFFNNGVTRNVRVEVQPQLLGTDGTQTSRTRNTNFPIGMVNF